MSARSPLYASLVALAAAGCAGDDSTQPFPSTAADAGKDAAVSADASVADAARAIPDAAPDSPPSTTALVRFANWAADAPAVDVCLAPHGTGAFARPALYAALADGGGDAGAASLAFPAATAYLAVPPGQYDARIVAAGAWNCDAGIADGVQLPAMPVGSLSTLALVGEAHPAGSGQGLRIVGFVDDAQAAGAMTLRFINAAPGIASADLGLGSAATFQPLFTGGSFAQPAAARASDAGPSDGNGYASIAPFAQTTLTVRASGASSADLAVAAGVSATKGSLLTFVLLGNPTGAPAVQLLECVDNAQANGLLGRCAILSSPVSLPFPSSRLPVNPL